MRRRPQGANSGTAHWEPGCLQSRGAAGTLPCHARRWQALVDAGGRRGSEMRLASAFRACQGRQRVEGEVPTHIH